MGAEEQYEALILGQVGDLQHRVVGGLLAKGRGRLEEKVSYIEGRGVTIEDLKNLDRGIEQAMGMDYFMSRLGFRTLPEELKEPWQRFQGAVCELVSLEFLDTIGEFRYREFVSNEELSAAMKRVLKKDPNERVTVTDSAVFIAKNLSNGRRRRVRHTLNDGFGVTKDEEGHLDQMDTIYEFKSTPPHYSNPHAKKRANRLKALLGSNTVMHLMDDAFAEIFGIELESGDVAEIVPFEYESRKNPFEGIRRELVIVGGSPVSKDARRYAPLFSEIKTLGMPNVRSLGYFILKFLTGEIPERSSWEKYFQPVKSK